MDRSIKLIHTDIPHDYKQIQFVHPGGGHPEKISHPGTENALVFDDHITWTNSEGVLWILHNPNR